jgi:hypothetical protein
MKSMHSFFHALAVVVCGLVLWTSASEAVLGQTRPPATTARKAPVRSSSVRSPTRPAPSRTLAARPSAIAPLRASDDEAIRMLKLGNTYREARDYDLAQKYINQGLEALTKSGNRYWQATGYEYLGLTYRDMGDRPAALAALQRASDLFNAMMKNPAGKNSRNSTQMLLDNMQRDDASRLQPMPLAAPPTRTLPSRNPSGMSPPPMRPRDLPPAPNATRAAAAPNSLEAERALNAQLTQRLAALEERIRALDRPTPGASPAVAMPTTSAAPPVSSNPPGAVARTLPQRTGGDKPQGEFAPFQTDKKPVPTSAKPAPAQTVKKDTVLPLPIFTLQIGVGAGYYLNRPLIGLPVTPTLANQKVFTGNTPTEISFPLLSISGDFFLSPNFSLGLMYAYYPGLNRKDSTTITVAGVTTATTYTDYHFLTLRPAVHFVRNQTADVYAGLALGSMLNFQPLRLYAGLFVGGQYNFTRQFGLFLELSGGGQYTGETSLTIPANIPQTTEPRLLTIGNGIVQIAAYGRLGLAFNF